MLDWNRKIIEEFRANKGRVASFRTTTALASHSHRCEDREAADEPVGVLPRWRPLHYRCVEGWRADEP